MRGEGGVASVGRSVSRDGAGRSRLTLRGARLRSAGTHVDGWPDLECRSASGKADAEKVSSFGHRARATADLVSQCRLALEAQGSQPLCARRLFFSAREGGFQNVECRPIFRAMGGACS